MEIRSVIEQLRQDERELRIKIEDLRRSIEKKISAAESDLAHILGTIAFYEREQVCGHQLTTLETPVEDSDLSKLRTMSHKEAVVAIAKRNNGVIKSQHAKELMIRAGIMAQTKNSNRMVHNAIKGTGRFERTAPGEYRLRSPLAPKNMMTELGGNILAAGKPIQ